MDAVRVGPADAGVQTPAAAELNYFQVCALRVVLAEGRTEDARGLLADFAEQLDRERARERKVRGAQAALERSKARGRTETRPEAPEGRPEAPASPTTAPRGDGSSPSRRRHWNRLDETRRHRRFVEDHRKLGASGPDPRAFPRGLKARCHRIATEGYHRARFLRELPAHWRAVVVEHAHRRTDGTWRGVCSRVAAYRVALVALLWGLSLDSGKRGRSRSISGYTREAIASCGPHNPETGAAFSVDTLRALLRELESARLIERIRPPAGPRVHVGPSGYAYGQIFWLSGAVGSDPRSVIGPWSDIQLSVYYEQLAAGWPVAVRWSPAAPE